LIFTAPTKSALAENPHSTQTNFACVLRFSAAVCWHSGHLRLVFCGGTDTRSPPRHRVLYSNCRRNSNGLASRMERFSPTKRCIELRSPSPVAAHRQVLLEECAVVAVLLRRILWRRAPRWNQTLRRAAGHTAIVVAYPGLKSRACATHWGQMAAGIYDDALFGQTKISHHFANS